MFFFPANKKICAFPDASAHHGAKKLKVFLGFSSFTPGTFSMLGSRKTGMSNKKINNDKTNVSFIAPLTEGDFHSAHM